MERRAQVARDVLLFAALLGGAILLRAWVLPALGVPT